MDPVAFRVFGIEVKWYGILIVLGVALGMLLCSRREKRFSLPKDTTVNLILIALPLALVCARAYYVIFSWDYYSAHPDRILSVRDGGLAIYGGLLGGMLGARFSTRGTRRFPSCNWRIWPRRRWRWASALAAGGISSTRRPMATRLPTPPGSFSLPRYTSSAKAAISRPRSFTNPPGASSSCCFCCWRKSAAGFASGAMSFWPTRCCTRWSAPWWKACAATACIGAASAYPNF